jgi:hypothetical protein
MGALMGRRHGVWIAAVVALAGCFTLSGGAKTKDLPWIANDWTQWKEEDCKIVLQQSPWVFYFHENSNIVYGNSAQLRSALPIRQALLRQQELNNHYDKLTPAQKQTFDQQRAADLAASDASPILLYVDHYYADDYPGAGFGPESGRRVALRLASGALVFPTETKQEKVSDAYVENAFLYTFPRMIDGRPAFTVTDKEVVFMLGGFLPKADKEGKIAPQRPEDFHAWTREFEEKDKKTKKVLGTVEVPVEYTFKIADMMYKGKLEY